MPLRISHQELSANRWTTDRDMTFTDMLLSLLGSTAAAAEAKNMGEHCSWLASSSHESELYETPICEHMDQQQAMDGHGGQQEGLVGAVLRVAGVCCLRSPLSGVLTHVSRPAGLGGVVGAARGGRAQSATGGGSAGCAAGPGGRARSALRLQCRVAKAMDWYARPCRSLCIGQFAVCLGSYLQCLTLQDLQLSCTRSHADLG